MPKEENTPVSLHVSDDKMKIAADCCVLSHSPEELKRALLAAIEELGISADASNIDLEAWLRAATPESGDIEGALLCRGQAPTPPRHGDIKWAGDFFNEGFLVDSDTGAIDFRRRAGATTVEEGQLLGEVIAPLAGKEGRDVFGNNIEPEAPRIAEILAGENVRGDPETGFYAEQSGRIRWDPPRLHVDLVYTITGDVGLDTGHISHPGSLFISGDILEGSEVNAAGDIEVRGIIEPANVEAGGDLTVGGGIVGGPDFSTQVGGTLFALYLLDANVRAKQGVMVEKEIVNSSLWTAGMVSISRGRIVGGEVVAVQGVDVGQIGTEASIPTILVLGEDAASEERLAQKQKRVDELRQTHSKIHGTVEPLRKHADELPPAKLEVVNKLIEKAGEIEAEIDVLEQEIEQAQDEHSKSKKAEASIHLQVHPETTFQIRKETLRVRSSVQGPLKAIFRGGRVKLVSAES